MDSGLKLTDEVIQKLFGNEAAEDESIERLREYYFKHDIYYQVIAALPLRILVGHKGIGKSALFKVAISEDSENGKLPILIKPDDIADIDSSSEDFLILVRTWKEGLNRIIGEKVLETIGVSTSNKESFRSSLSKYGGRTLRFLIDTSKKLLEKNIDLAPAQKLLIQNFLKNREINIYIDDLDRGWMSGRSDINRISALLNAARDISNENTGLYFKISLRSDVYFLVRTSDESTDKIEGSVIWYTWTNHEILVMLVKRIETFFGNQIDEGVLLGTEQRNIAYHLDPVMEKKFNGRGKWKNAPMYRILMSLTRKRPRDLVKLCTLAAKEAHRKKASIITTSHFEKIFEEYSQGRIQDTINEFRSELPDIERLIFGMRPSKKEKKASDSYFYNTSSLKMKLNSIGERGSFRFRTGKVASAVDLAAFLYKINFITARKELDTGEIQRRYFEENRYLSASFVDFGYDWEIHPAYRWALQPDSIYEIFENLDLSADNSY